MSEPSPAGAPPGANERSRGLRRRLADRRVLAAAGLLLLAAALWWWWRTGRVTTDDAKVEGAIHPVSARVSGPVEVVRVDDNDLVREGTVLFELDDRDYVVALDKAKADLAAAEAAARAADRGLPVTATGATSRLDAARAELQSAHSGVQLADGQSRAARARLNALLAGQQEAQTRAEQARRDLERIQPLAAKDQVSRQQLEAAETEAATLRARVAALGADVAAARSELEVAAQRLAQAKELERRAEAQLEAAQTAPQQIEVSEAEAAIAAARVEQARALLERAQLDLAYTKVRAPASGRVTRKAVEVGQMVEPGRPVLAVVALEDVWIEAKFKETQLRRLRRGQHALVKVDAYPGRALPASVDSIGAATAGRFALFPAENATGNFVKVVQRVPVRLVLAEPPAPDAAGDPESDRERLRPGMSVVVTVLVRKPPGDAPTDAGAPAVSETSE